MNATTQSSIKARNPQYVPSRAPRIVAAVAAIIMTIVLFDGVALLGGRDNGTTLTSVMGTVVAQTTNESTAR